MASKTEVCNLALSHLGVGKEISNIDTDTSEEAYACKRFYETARDSVLREFLWPFATKFLTLALVETDPNDEWAYSYRYPTDCLKIRKVLSGVRNDTRQSRIPYKIAQDDSGLLIFCDLDRAQIEYTVRAEDPFQYSSDFVMAFSYMLAGLIAPRVTGGDPFKLKSQVMQLYTFELGKAKATAFDEQQDEEIPDSEFIRMRE